MLHRDGATILGVGSGFQACGETGDGRMLEPPELLEDIIAFFQPKLLAGKRVPLSEVGLFCDGTAVKQVGTETLRMTREVVDEFVAQLPAQYRLHEG